MRTCFLLLIGAATLASTPAPASVVTVGGSFAETCYRAAESRRPDRDAWNACDLALASQALSIEDRAGTLVNRAILFMDSGRDDRALLDLAEAARLDPDQPETFINQAVIAYRQGSVRDARDLAARAIALGTRKPEYAHYLRGVANEDLGEIGAAFADLSTAARLAPRWSDPRRELARYRQR